MFFIESAWKFALKRQGRKPCGKGYGKGLRQEKAQCLKTIAECGAGGGEIPLCPVRPGPDYFPAQAPALTDLTATGKVK